MRRIIPRAGQGRIKDRAASRNLLARRDHLNGVPSGASVPQDREKERQEALGAVERLYRKGVLDLQEATLASRMISGQDGYAFPPPAPQAPAPAPEPSATQAPAEPGPAV